MQVGELGEFALIARLQGLLDPEAHPQVVQGIGDDCAVLRPSAGAELVWTTDTQEEGVHFRREWSTPQDIGWRCLAVNVSDIAAMGGAPLGALVALSLPRNLDVAFVEGLYEGMQALASAYACPIIGGNLSRSADRVGVTITVLGEAPTGQTVYRSGARPGDAIWVTGTLGGAKAGLEVLGHPELTAACPTAHALACYRRPRPRLREAQMLRQQGGLHSLLDISDGLSGDLTHVCEASGVGALLEADRIPLHDEVRQIAAALQADPLSYALHGGEDFELCMTASPGQLEALQPDFERQFACQLHRVGTIQAGRGITLQHTDGRRDALAAQGYDHFRQGDQAKSC